MNLKALNKIYFLGIGGIGMSAIARYFNDRGVEVHGYDLVNSKLTKKLEAEGMIIHYDEDVNKIPRDTEMVVLTPAIPHDHKELIWFEKNGYPIKKRAEILGLLSHEKRTIAVAGTHGKTTTSSLIAHVLKSGGVDVSAFLGGIVVNENSNYFSGQSDIVVLEADEYDRSFLHLTPDILVILSMDADHLDIYGTVETMRQAYEQLCHQIKPGGKLILAHHLISFFDHGFEQNLKSKGIELSYFQEDFNVQNIKIENHKYHFDFETSKTKIKGIKSILPGLHNLSNTSVALYIGELMGLDAERLKKGIERFKGIKRRFEIVQDGKRVLIDDYAHHPEELRHAVKTAMSLYDDKKILGIFQPHLYSRTKDFYRGFAKELSPLHEIWLLPIYPARELPMEGIQSELIFNLITNDNKKLMTSENFLDALKEKKDIDVIMTIGAADLDKYHPQILEIING